MDLYGRPQAPPARRASKPTVSFLNDQPRSQSFSSSIAAPALLSSANARQAVETLQYRVSSSQTSGNNYEERPSPAGQAQQSRPPLSARPTARPQSGGIRRTDVDGVHFEVRAMVKPRPRTAREGMRTAVPPQSGFSDTNSQSKTNPAVKVAENNRDRGLSWLDTKEATDQRPETEEYRVADPRREQLYIAQLKDDIICLRELRGAQNKDPGGKAMTQRNPTTHSGHSHVNNVLLMRERRTSGWHSPLSSQSDLSNQLERYNYSSDPFQLSTAKMRLEDLLERELTEFVQALVVNTDEDEDDSRIPDTKDSQKFALFRSRPTNLSNSPADLNSGPLPFANGCATSAGSIYTGALLAVLEQAERLKQTTLASIGEKCILAKEAAQKDEQLRELHEQIAIFKDVIMRARLSIDKDVDTSTLSRLRAEQERSAAAEMSNAMSQEFEKFRNEHEEIVRQFERKSAKIEKELQTTRTVLSNAEVTISELRQQVSCAEEKTHAAIEATEALRSQKLLAEAAANKLREQLAEKTKQIDQRNRQLAATDDRVTALDELAKREKEERARLLQINLELEKALGCCKKDSASFLVDQQRLKFELSTTLQLLQKAQGEKTSLNTSLSELRAQLEGSERLIHQKLQLLEINESKVVMLMQELERQRAATRHHENQVQLLEEKLSRSIAVDADAWQRKREEEQSTWHQQLTALEHALYAEKQQRERIEQQFAREMKAAKENEEHATMRAATLTEELTTANLCIAERKRQSDAQKEDLEATIALLKRERGERQDSVTQLKVEMQNQVTTNQLYREEMNNAVAAIKSELVDAQQQKLVLQTQLVELEAKLAASDTTSLSEAQQDQTLGTPRRKGHITAELRVELTRARQRIASLEEKLAKKASESGSASARREKESQESRLSMREKRLVDDQKAMKKLEEKLAGEKSDLEAIKRRQDEDKGLLRAIISLLAARLQTQMALFAAIPGDIAAASEQSHSATTSDERVSSLNAFLAGFKREYAEQWRGLQELWETLRAELENADWQLIHMKNRLEELHLEYVGQPVELDDPRVKAEAATRTGKQSQVAVRPFSEAVAAGKETVPVAEQLKSSSSARGLAPAASAASSPSSSPERRALRAKAEEQETFALALAQEMRAMKERYEKQLEDTRAELLTAQRLRADTAHRLRTDLDNERQRHQQTASQLGERVAALEARVAQLQQLLDARQAAELPLLDVLCGPRSSSTEHARGEATRQLVQLATASCAEERERRARRLAYCGSSSVSVPGRELLGEYPS